MTDKLPILKILGSRVHIVQISDIVSIMNRWIQERKGCRQIVVTGFHGLWEAFGHPELKKIFNSAELWVPDGIAPVWAARLRGFSKIRRTPGHDILKGFLQLADSRGYRSFFYGDTEETLALLQQKLMEKYPGHKTVGVYSPPFRPLTAKEDEEVMKMIEKARPDVLWVGLGCPKQDKWIYQHKNRLDVPVAIGVGAVFRFVAGTVRRCPDWIGNSGFEWLFRFLMEPKKLWKRDLIDGTRFSVCVLLELLGLKKYD